MFSETFTRMTLPRMILLSGLMHFLLIGTTVFIAYPGRARTFYRPQYQVRLVQPEEIPSLKTLQSQENLQPTTPPEPVKVEKKAVVVPEKAEKPKPKKATPEESPQKSSRKPPREIKRKDEIEEAFKRIKKDLKYRDLQASKEPAMFKGLTGIEGTLKYNEYYDQIEQRVRQNWSPPENYDPGAGDLVTVVSLSILPDGTIERSWVEKSSGNRYFDESVMRAILKSNPLPPPPTGFVANALEVGLRFHSNPDYDTTTTP